MKSNILHILAITFAGTAFLKLGHIAMASDAASALGTGSGDMVAQNAKTMKNGMGSDVEGESSELPGQDMCLTGVLAQTLADQQASLAEKELDIAKREAALKALEARVSAQIEEVQVVENSIRDHRDLLERAATEDITHLVQMYETMKPQKAAEIFDKMDPAFAAGFLRQINGSKAGLILAGMEAHKSYKVSLIMAEQGASWRN